MTQGNFFFQISPVLLMSVVNTWAFPDTISFSNKTSGVVSQAKVTKVTDDGCVIYLLKDGLGGGKVPIKDLPQNLQDAFGAPPEESKPVKPKPLYEPTQEQARLESGPYFNTKVDEFDRIVTHSLYGIDSENKDFNYIISRKVQASGASIYKMFIKLDEQSFEEPPGFKENAPVVFIIDGSRFSIEDKSSHLRTTVRSSIIEFGITEELLRSFCNSKKACMRVQLNSGNCDYEFSSNEITRIKLFVSNYLPLQITIKP